MQRFKKFLYYGSVVLPIINKIISFIKLLYELNVSNHEVIKARNDIYDLIKSTQQSVSDFNKTMEE